jgi:hypothetical protein
MASDCRSKQQLKGTLESHPPAVSLLSELPEDCSSNSDLNVLKLEGFPPLHCKAALRLANGHLVLLKFANLQENALHLLVDYSEIVELNAAMEKEAELGGNLQKSRTKSLHFDQVQQNVGQPNTFQKSLSLE